MSVQDVTQSRSVASDRKCRRRRLAATEEQGWKGLATEKQRRKFADIQLPLDRSGLVRLAQKSNHTFALEVGLLIAGHFLDYEVTRLCGPRYDRTADRQFTGYGHQRGVVTLSGQKLSVARQRVRQVGGGSETEREI